MRRPQSTQIVSIISLTSPDQFSTAVQHKIQAIGIRGWRTSHELVIERVEQLEISTLKITLLTLIPNDCYPLPNE